MRGDVLELARHMVRLVGPLGRAIVQIMATCLRVDQTGAPLGVLDAAVARGELPAGTDAERIVNTLIGALHHRVVSLHEIPDDAALAALIDLVLDGARAR